MPHSVSIEMSGFFRSAQLRFPLEKGENRYRKIYPGSYFRHRSLIKPVSFPVRKVPQIGQVTCTPVSNGAAAHYKKGYTRLRSFGNLLQCLALLSEPVKHQTGELEIETSAPVGVGH